MKSFQHCSGIKLLLFKLLPLLSSSVLALPLSRRSAVAPKTYISLTVILVSLFFILLVFLVIKLVYMKHRRIGTIHAPLGIVRSTRTCSRSSSISSLGFRDKQANRLRGLWVGCFGSPAWETSITSKLDQATRHQLHPDAIVRSTTYPASMRFKSEDSSLGPCPTKSTASNGCAGNTDQPVPPCSFGLARSPSLYRSGQPKTLDSMQRRTSTKCLAHYGDFGESQGPRLPGGVPQAARRASPSSVRLVDGPSHSNQVEYSFLSGSPPNAVAASPLMGVRDSFQLSRYSLKYSRKPVSTLPSLPSFLPFCVPEGIETHALPASEYLPPFHFSPLASVAKMFHSQQQALENYAPGSPAPISRVFGAISPTSLKTPRAGNTGSLTGSRVVRETATLRPVEKPNMMKSNLKRSQSCKGLAIDGSSLNDAAPREANLVRMRNESGSGVMRCSSGSSRHSSTVSKKPLKSCLRQNSAVSTPLVCNTESTLTPSMSETSMQTCTLGTSDVASLRTPVSEVDIGILGLDRFRWNDEIKELKVQSCHAKKDSVALVPYFD